MSFFCERTTPYGNERYSLRNGVCMNGRICFRHAIQIFLSSGVSGAPVLDDGRRLVGILSETDIIKKEAGKVQRISHIYHAFLM